MKKKYWIIILILIILVCVGACVFFCCKNMQKNDSSVDTIEYSYEEYPLERNDIELHLDMVSQKDADNDNNILLIHGVTYSSHEFDINYEDYSLVRKLAREGYNVWRLDIAGFGQSGKVEDGFMPDSDYAAEDINAAVDKIVDVTGQDKIDVLGWSWGTITVGRFASKYPEHINKVVLYAPILSGIGEYEVEAPFHYNKWDHAVEDFQKNDDGSIDYTLVDPVVVEMWASSCWHYDGDLSPNGGRRDVCVDASKMMFDLSLIKSPTLVICGDKDPYLNYKLVDKCLESLPTGSVYEKIPGGSHVVYLEKPFYHDFQDKLVGFLKN